MIKKSVCLVLVLFFLSACKGGFISASDCPKVEELQKALDNIQRGLVLEKIERSPIAGLCEVVVKLTETERALFYTDSKGQYVLSGHIIELSTKKNLTSEKVAMLNKRVLSKEMLGELDRVVAFTWGNAGKSLYFITDPDCPFCKQAEAILEELVKGGKLTVKVIFYPLEAIHPKAKAKSVAIICDNKGYEGLKTGYQSKNQCPTGIKKVEESIALMKRLGIRATPTFVFPDGEVKSGVMSPEAILSKLE